MYKWFTFDSRTNESILLASLHRLNAGDRFLPWSSAMALLAALRGSHLRGHLLVWKFGHSNSRKWDTLLSSCIGGLEHYLGV